MKKVKVLMAVVMLFLLAGCGAKPEDVYKKSMEKMDKLDSFHIDMKLDLVIDMGGTSMTVTVNGKQDYDIKKNVGYMEMSTSFMGKAETQKSYISINGNKETTYTEKDGIWTKEESESTSGTTDILTKATNSTQISEENGIRKYEVKVDAETIKELLGSNEDMNEFISVIDSENSKMFVYVNKDNYVSKLELEVPATKDEVKVTIKATLDFSKFNEVNNITIPEDVINNALDQKQVTLKENAQAYMDEVEWDVWGDEALENSVYTSIDLEYDGAKPTKVELTLKEGSVVSGTIEIEGYRATFKDSEIISFELIK